MDPLVVLGIVASIATVLGFLYVLIFGQRSLFDWFERRRKADASGPEAPFAASTASPRPEATALPVSTSPPPVSSQPSSADPMLSSTPPPLPAVLPGGGPRSQLAEDHDERKFIERIATDIEAKRCVFLLGTGVSIEAGVPSGAEVAEMLAREVNWKERDRPLPEIAQRYGDVRGPVKPVIHDYLQQRLEERDVKPTNVHRALACMADKLDVILTTNLDSLLEQAFAQARGRRCQRLYRDTQFSAHEPTQTTIVKLHGHLDDPDSYVVTQQDYQSSRMQNAQRATFLRHCLTSSTLVIIGYRQEDEDFKQIYTEALKDLKPEQPRRHVYLVDPRADIAWEQYWRDRIQDGFIHMSGMDFLIATCRQLGTIANRTQELKLGRDLLPDPYHKPVVEFCGLPGVGKTTLLSAIRRDYDLRHIYTATVSFDNADFCEAANASRRLIWEEIGRQLGLTAPYEHRAQLKDQLGSKRPATLFFDAVERAPKDTLGWLWETYLSLLDDLPDLRAVFAGRSPRLSTIWGYPRQLKVEPRRLTSFQNLADTQWQMVLAFMPDPALGRQVYQLTQGHPGMVRQVIEWLKTNDIRDHTALAGKRQEELSCYVDGLVENYVLKDVAADLKPLIRQLAHYRWFSWGDVGRLRQISAPEGKEFIHDQLLPTGLFEREAENNQRSSAPVPSFAVDRTLRALLVNLTRLQDMAGFIATMCEIGNQREAQAAKMHETWHLYVIEGLYHRANEQVGQRQLGRLEDASTFLLGWFDKQLQKTTRQERLLDLYEVMQGDEDLVSVLRQLHADLYPKLLQHVEARKKALEAKKHG